MCCSSKHFGKNSVSLCVCGGGGACACACVRIIGEVPVCTSSLPSPECFVVHSKQTIQRMLVWGHISGGEIIKPTPDKFLSSQREEHKDKTSDGEEFSAVEE